MHAVFGDDFGQMRGLQTHFAECAPEIVILPAHDITTDVIAAGCGPGPFCDQSHGIDIIAADELKGAGGQRADDTTGAAAAKFAELRIDISGERAGSGEKPVAGIGKQAVIGVQREEPAGFAGGDGDVTGGSEADIVMWRQDQKAVEAFGVTCGPVENGLHGLIGRRIVHDYQVEVRDGLDADGFERFDDEALVVMGGDDDGHIRWPEAVMLEENGVVCDLWQTAAAVIAAHEPGFGCAGGGDLVAE